VFQIKKSLIRKSLANWEKIIKRKSKEPLLIKILTFKAKIKILKMRSNYWWLKSKKIMDKKKQENLKNKILLKIAISSWVKMEIRLKQKKRLNLKINYSGKKMIVVLFANSHSINFYCKQIIIVDFVPIRSVLSVLKKK